MRSTPSIAVVWVLLVAALAVASTFSAWADGIAAAPIVAAHEGDGVSACARMNDPRDCLAGTDTGCAACTASVPGILPARIAATVAPRSGLDLAPWQLAASRPPAPEPDPPQI